MLPSELREGLTFDDVLLVPAERASLAGAAAGSMLPPWRVR